MGLFELAWVGIPLLVVGGPEGASELRRIQGLKPAHSSIQKLDLANHQRCLVEVVLGHEFAEQYRFRRDFLLVSALNDSTPPDFRRAPPALGILLLMALWWLSVDLFEFVKSGVHGIGSV